MKIFLQSIVQKKSLAIFLNLIFVLIVIGIDTQTHPGSRLHEVSNRLENLMFDFRMKTLLPSEKGSNAPVAILDIDELSLAEEGRWPWPRSKIRELLQKLQEAGAIVIAFDVIFSEPELNIAES